jgi:hypothetical protein
MDKTKVIEIWLSNADQQQGSEKFIRRLCADWRDKKYRIALFRSGSGDLFSSAEGLLLNNLAV